MGALVEEVDAHFARFKENWRDELTGTMASLDASEPILKESYRRITSLNAWRGFLEAGIADEEVQKFFIEAQNDALTSHVLASMWSFLSALKSLRSCIENVLFTLYYKDHPIEMKLWLAGEHKMGFESLHKYLLAHPELKGIDPNHAGLGSLKDEYSTLSRAVHASSSRFRMTDDDEQTNIWSDDVIKLRQWKTREDRTLASINKLLLSLNKASLTGTAHRGLRQAASFTLPTGARATLEESLGIALFDPLTS